MKLILAVIALCIVLVGLTALFLLTADWPMPPNLAATAPATMAHDSMVIVTTAAPEPDAAIPTSARAAGSLPTTNPVRWATDPATQDALHRLERAQSALRTDPQNPAALRDQAQALIELHAWPQACDTLRALTRLEPHDTGLRFELASAYMKLQRWTDALETLKTVLAEQPEHVRARFNLAVAQQASGRLADARRAWDRCIELAPSPEAFARRGEVLLDLHEWAAAAADFARVLDAEPTAVDAALNRALALARQGLLDEARATLLQVLERVPRHIGALNRLAELTWEACRGGDPAACAATVEWCRRSLEIDPAQPEICRLRDDALLLQR